MYESVIVPLDGTPVAGAALPAARKFAREAQASILLVSVLEMPDAFVTWERRPEPDVWLAERERETRAYLDKVAARLGYPEVETRVVVGDPVRLIQQEIEQARQPLLIMARRPRSRMRERFSRGTSIRTARHATCPLVIIPADDNAAEPSADFTMNSVLVPLDGSRHAERVLPAITEEVLNPKGLQIHLLRIIETTAWHGSSQAVMYAYNFDRYISDMCAIATPYLSKIRDSLAPLATQVDCDVRVGHAAEQICLAADELDVELIAMSTHGRSGIERFLLGSVAEAVIVEAHRPVLLIRATA